LRTLAHEQTITSFFTHSVPVGEIGLAAYSNNFHDVAQRVFRQCNQANNQQALARPIRLLLILGFFDLLYDLLSKFRKCSHAETDIPIKNLN
jgi:hypothetical protein